MNRIVLVLAALLAASAGYAQQDSTTQQKGPDTVRVGNFIIIKKNKDGKINDDSDHHRGFNISIGSRRRQRSNLSTNWLIFDLGFANWRDKTNYTAAQSAGFLQNIPYSGHPENPVTENSFNLKNVKSSNVNIWLFMQKLNITSHVLNLKYGLGLEMYNYRFESNISFRNDPVPFAYNDSISFSKNKLYAGYVTIPVMLNINATPNRNDGLSFSAGVSAGYLVGSRNKQISSERGKQKAHGGLNLETWRLAAVGEVGLGPIRLFGSYSLNTLFKKDKTGLEQYPYSFGIRFSNW
jgi:hypothetical protein